MTWTCVREGEEGGEGGEASQLKIPRVRLTGQGKMPVVDMSKVNAMRCFSEPPRDPGPRPLSPTVTGLPPKHGSPLYAQVDNHHHHRHHHHPSSSSSSSMPRWTSLRRASRSRRQPQTTPTSTSPTRSAFTRTAGTSCPVSKVRHLSEPKKCGGQDRIRGKSTGIPTQVFRFPRQEGRPGEFHPQASFSTQRRRTTST